MRKILTLVMTVAMLAVMTISASAAPVSSPAAKAAPEVSAVAASDGTVISSEDIVIAPAASASEEVKAAYQEIASAPSVSAFLESNNLEVDTAEEMEFHSVFDVTATGAAAEVLANGGTLEMTFDVPGLKAGDKAAVLHQKHDSTWENVTGKISDGKITGKFTSLSPVAILVEADAPNAGTITSPQTGDVNVEGALVLGMVACAAFVVYSMKRRVTD